LKSDTLIYTSLTQVNDKWYIKIDKNESVFENWYISI